MKKLKFILFFFFPLFAEAQDFHFSQFYHSPLTLNPAMSGVFSGDLRAASNYRSQWGWSSDVVAFRTIAGSVDFSLFKNNKDNNFVGMGVQLFNDIAGDARFQQMKADVSIAVNKTLDRDGIYNLALGLQGGYFQKGFNASGLSYDNQWDGRNYDPARSTGETTFSGSTSFMDFGAGLLWYIIPRDGKSNFYLGASAFHLTQPDQSLFNEKDPLKRKYILHSKAFYTLANSGRALEPYLLMMKQDKHFETTLGSYLRINRDGTENDKILFFLGAFFRIVGNEYRPAGSDAIIPAIKAEYENFTFGLTYDVNISNLNVLSKGRGGLELSLLYRSSFSKGKKRSF